MVITGSSPGPFGGQPLTSLSVPDTLSELVVRERQGHIRDLDEQIKMNPGFALTDGGREVVQAGCRG